jgi:hypothetical protein
VAAQDNETPKLRRVLELPFPGDRAPPELSASIVSLVELCQIAMPDPAAMAKAIEGAGFVQASANEAERIAQPLALDKQVFSFSIRNLRHKLFGLMRGDQRVRLLISEAESSEGPVIFCTAVFSGAMEADAVKAAAHVTNKQPFTGATLVNAGGEKVRRVFWDVEGVSGVRGFMVSGPEDVEALDNMRAFTAFNMVSTKKV